MKKRPQFGMPLSILSEDPLITLTETEPPRLYLGEALDFLPRIAEAKQAVHFIGFFVTIEDVSLEEFEAAVSQFAKDLPHHHAVFLTLNEWETALLSARGLTAITCNGSILIDETRNRVVKPSVSRFRSFDAIYNARPDLTKRHELASAIPRLNLITTGKYSPEFNREIAEVRRKLPKANIENFDASGRYNYLMPDQINQAHANAAAALALSAREGYMRTSIEALLCGCPVVSTEALGSRTRYYDPAYSRITAPDPDAVWAAVRELKRARLPRAAIRAQTGRYLAHERAIMERQLNRTLDHLLGGDAPFLPFHQMRGAIIGTPSLDDTIALHGQQLQAYHAPSKPDAITPAGFPSDPDPNYWWPS